MAALPTIVFLCVFFLCGTHVFINGLIGPNVNPRYASGSKNPEQSTIDGTEQSIYNSMMMSHRQKFCVENFDVLKSLSVTFINRVVSERFRMNDDNDDNEKKNGTETETVSLTRRHFVRHRRNAQYNLRFN